MPITNFERKALFKRQYLTFAGKSSKDYLLYLSAPGVDNAPEVDVELTTVPGKNGDVIMDNAKRGQRRYKNLDITYGAFFFEGIPAKTAAVKSWLLSPVGYQRLQDTYDPDSFRMATCKNALEFEPVRKQKAAKMELTFHCQPQRWSVEGQRRVLFDAPGIIRNPFAFFSQPLIRVYGTGEGNLYVGDNLIKILSFPGKYIDLNCETHNAYAAADFCNDCIKSDDFPMLLPGKNSIHWTGNITSVEIIPRWWTL